jgi:hypothetical protein
MTAVHPADDRAAAPARDDDGFVSGMPAHRLGAHGWECPWSSPNGGDCVEVKRLPGGRVAFRQSKDPEGPALIYDADEISAFLRGVKRGEADHLYLPGNSVFAV